MKRNIGSATLLLLLATLSTPTLALPMLLDTFGLGNGGGGGGPVPFLDATGVVFHLGYESYDCSQVIGCEKIWDFGETGSMDFNSSNSANFDTTVAMMTDNILQDLQAGSVTVLGDLSNVAHGGGIFSYADSALVGANIDFIRLNVTATEFSQTPFGSGGGYFRVLRYNGNFEVWGTRAVPVPATASLMGIGFLLWFGLIRRRSFTAESKA